MMIVFNSRQMALFMRFAPFRSAGAGSVAIGGGGGRLMRARRVNAFWNTQRGR